MSAFSSLTNDDVKNYHGVLLADASHDTQITTIRPLVDSYILNYVRHDIEQIVRTDESPIIMKFQSRFYLRFRPVLLTPFTLKIDGTELTQDTDYFVNERTGMVEKIQSTNDIRTNATSFWTTTRRQIKVTYTGGEALPDDVKMVFFELVGILSHIKTKTFIDNEGVEQSVTLTSIPPDFLLILDRHKQQRL